MPFQSEKQRRYLWANEPEIAREWTDRYGAAAGGITRLGFRRGNPHGGSSRSSSRSSSGPGPGGQGARGQATQNPGRPSGPGPGGQGATGQATQNRGVTTTRSRIQEEKAAEHRRNEQRKEIARQEAEKDYVDIITKRKGLQRAQLLGQQRKQEYKPSFFNRLGGGIGNLLRGAGNLIGRLPINPMTLASGGLNFMGQDKLAQLLASINLGKGGNFFNKQNNTIDNNQLGLFTDRMNDEYVDEGRVGQDIRWNRPNNLSADAKGGIETLEDQMRDIFTTS